MWIIAGIFYVATNIMWLGVHQQKIKQVREEAYQPRVEAVTEPRAEAPVAQVENQG